MVDYTEVSIDTFAGLYDPILDKVKNAQYVAIDCEFTGHLRDLIVNLDHRYDGMAQVVRTHSILSVGLTTITSDRQFSNFEFLLNNQMPYQVNVNNLKFLSENGFDFNRHYRVGIPFTPGPYTPRKKASDPTLRYLFFDIFNILRTKGIPLIVHNGLLDLMYIYQSFITTLPAKLHGFVADMVEAFPGGIYDTKYIAMHLNDEQTTFLAYLYHKYQRTGYKANVQHTIQVAKEDVQPKKRQRKNNDKVDEGICDQFATRGWCHAGSACERSHDLNRILDRDQNVDTAPAPQNPSLEQPVSTLPPEKPHSSHYDAFMTGYIFCYMATQVKPDVLQDAMNKINVMRLSVPLRIAKSAYSKPTLAWEATKQHLKNRQVAR
ncbi:ribonuclease H-like domain-containing protein [Fennellomyces sp. T-0311]|nr:ribonuclease H-like domain-containing protein [Fennellomyces sp. T-0311]